MEVYAKRYATQLDVVLLSLIYKRNIISVTPDSSFLCASAVLESLGISFDLEMYNHPVFVFFHVFGKINQVPTSEICYNHYLLLTPINKESNILALSIFFVMLLQKLKNIWST